MRPSFTLVLTVVTFVYGGGVAIAYLVGWVSPHVFEALSFMTCLAVALWYGVAVIIGERTILHRWGWFLLACGWFLIVVSFLFRPGIWRIITLSCSIPTLLGGFGTVWLANWYAQTQEGGEKFP